MSDLNTPNRTSRSNQNFLEDSINGRLSSGAFKNSAINGKVSFEILEFNPHEERVPTPSVALIQQILSNMLSFNQLYEMEYMLDNLIGRLTGIHSNMLQVKQEN